jgi:hypothetical protein
VIYIHAYAFANFKAGSGIGFGRWFLNIEIFSLIRTGGKMAEEEE